MGRQSSRIWLADGTDHKEMVTWNGSGFQYHDQAYIWNGSTFDLVWERLPNLKLLYLSSKPIQPSASKNNKYLYFTENNVGSTIYRIVIDADEPEKVEYWTSEVYDNFTAPVSSQAIAMHYDYINAWSFRYRILNLDTGEIEKSATFNAEDEGLGTRGIENYKITSQDLSKGLTGNVYAATIGSFIYGQTGTRYSLLWIFGYVDGVSFYRLDNTSLTENDPLYNNRWMYSLGRPSNDYLPRILILSNSETVLSVLQFGLGTNYGMYSVKYQDTLPFTLAYYSQHTAVRDNKIAFMADDGEIWIATIGDSSISWNATGIYSIVRNVVQNTFDITPDYKYLLVEDADNDNHYTIVRLSDKKKIMDLTSAVTDIDFSNPATRSTYFVGNKCVFCQGVANGTVWNTRYALYKWR